ncbi:ATP-binding protein [Jeotgalibacillus sp. S-D1]|uniref:ATP-binding protein n=1 Tax=Jeotgalibacillus sp. S-D1 TaxID=2552189 RepID=UPI00105A3CD1|nr:ATP-binding protein [Jeotgalibacillus sp. S-D1]
MKVLLGLFILLFIIEMTLVIAGLNGLVPTDVYIASEIFIALLIAVTGSIIFYRYRKVKNLFVEMEEEELKMTALIQSMPDFVCFKDGEGRWIRTNDFGLELYELEENQYIGKTDRQLGELNPFFKDAFDYCATSDEETWQNAETVRCEESFYIPSGELKTFDVIKVPIFFKNGQRKALITIGRDISQQKIAEERLVRQEKLAVAGELAAGVAHEIKNPLTSLKGFVQLMREAPMLSNENIGVMSSEIDRIHSIVEELLVLSKPRTRLEESFSIHAAIEYVLNLMKHQAMDKDVTLHFEKAEAEFDLVLGDRNQLVQVIINLVKNGIEAMNEGGRLTIRSRNQKSFIEVSIEDKGTGISNVDLEQLGQPFFTTKPKGMGLGITICHKIIHEHRGQLTFRSELNKGTTVQIKLPLYKKEEFGT